MRDSFIFAVESFLETYRSTGLMPINHYNEVEQVSDELPFKLNIKLYSDLEDSGNLRCFTIRDSENNALIGYAAFTLGRGRHSAESIVAYQDSFYIRPEFRGKGLGTNFVAFIDEYFEQLGIDCVYHAVKVKHDWSKILEDQGYVCDERIYMKILPQRKQYKNDAENE